MKTETLLQFCAKAEDAREYLRTPMSYRGRALFTNARIIVSTPWKEEYSQLGARPLPNATQLNSLTSSFNSQPMDLPGLQPDLCTNCGGTLKGDCRECDGTGMLHLSNHFHDYEMSCQSCQIGINKECMICDDTGFQSESVTIGGAIVDARYIAKVQTLLSEQRPIFRLTGHKENGSHLAIRFDFEGGYGFILCMRRPSEEKHTDLNIPVHWEQLH